MSDQRLFPDESATDADGIPPLILEGLRAYGIDHRPVGGFLTAMLSNDLMGAVASADNASLPAMGRIVAFMWNAMPAICYGSPEKVKAWLGENAQ